MRIVVLDGYTLNPGDLSWDALRALGECEIYDRTAPGETLARAGGAEIVLTNKTVLSAETIAALPKLKYIGVLATGYNIVDVAAARKRNVPVANVPAYATGSVAQMVFAHLLNLTQHVGEHAAGARAGRWAASRDFAYWDFPLIELGELTMGLVGMGRIGRETARLAAAFGMKVLAHSPHPRPTEGVQFVDLPTLLRQSDVVSLHCPMTDQTAKLINAERLAMMKPTAFLINTSRGGLIDDSALAAALNAGRLAGAGLDVLTVEPPNADNPLLTAKNCYLTPHIAWATQSARKRLMAAAVENVRAFLAGTPQNVVN